MCLANMTLSEGKFDSALSTLRSEIVEGVYGPGGRLPSQAEVCGKYGVGVATVQRVYQTLIDEGFLRVGARRSGTFVADNPPHLCNYGIVIPILDEWSRCYTAVRGAEKLIESEDIHLMEYRVSGEVGSRGDIIRLCKDVHNHRLAGLIIFATKTEMACLKGTRILDEPGVARVLLAGYPEFNLPMVFPDGSSFLDRSVEYLLSRGRRRIAHLRVLAEGTKWQEENEFGEAVRQRGAEFRGYWSQGVGLGRYMQVAASSVELLMQLEGDKKPDALIIHDDNLVEASVTGLLTAGVKVPDELEIVSHENYPYPVDSVLPMRRLGFDWQTGMKEAINLIQMQNEGRTLPKQVMLPACFDDEVGTDAV